MQIVEINYVSALVAAIASMVIGFLWYGPVFGKTWARLMNMDMKGGDKSGMMKSYGLMLVGSFLMAMVFAHVLKYSAAATLVEALQGGFWMWLGFPVPLLMGSVLWEQKPWALYLINVGYQFVYLMAAAAIIFTMG